MRHLALPLLVLTSTAQAAILRGKVTTPLGQPLPGARVQLIALAPSPRNAADAISGLDGTYEIRIDLAGRFLLLTSPSVYDRSFAPQIGIPFYAGRTDLLTLDITLNPSTVAPQTTTQPTLLETPLPQLSTLTTPISAQQLLPHATPLPELRPLPSASILQLGPLGTPAFLFLRGAAPAATKVMVDSLSADNLARGRGDQAVSFNLSTLSSSALSAPFSTPALELTAAANPLYFLGAEAGVLTLSTPRATDVHPNLLLSVDAGNLAALRDEAVITLAHSRADLLASFSRFDTDNGTPVFPFHIVTAGANLGYFISANTSLRLTLRNDRAATNLPTPFLFLPAGRQGNQNLYSTFTFDTRTEGNWHNLLRFGLLRWRSESSSFPPLGSASPVTITGANGYTTTGLPSFFALPAREDAVTNRDEFTFQTDRPLTRLLTALLTVRYQNEHAADITDTQAQRVSRNHLSLAASLQGELRHRLFATASGFLDYSALLGPLGAPRLGLTYVPVFPSAHAGRRLLHGTSLHLTAAIGSREPSLLEQSLLLHSPTSLIAPRSRTLDVSVNQNLLAEKLLLRLTYFYNQFSHEPEPVNLAPLTLTQNLAFRTQGLESALNLQPFPRVTLLVGYTYLASLTERSDATAVFNPSLSLIPIGSLTALPGARPFHRPPQSGSLTLAYTGANLSASLKATHSSRSDDSTAASALSFSPTLLPSPNLLLPNRNLSPSYTVLDADLTYAFTHHITAYTELTNLSNERHLAPIGFLSTPFLIRTGLRIRLGRE